MNQASQERQKVTYEAVNGGACGLATLTGSFAWDPLKAGATPRTFERSQRVRVALHDGSAATSVYIQASYHEQDGCKLSDPSAISTTPLRLYQLGCTGLHAPSAGVHGYVRKERVRFRVYARWRFNASPDDAGD